VHKASGPHILASGPHDVCFALFLRVASLDVVNNRQLQALRLRLVICVVCDFFIFTLNRLKLMS